MLNVGHAHVNVYARFMYSAFSLFPELYVVLRRGCIYVSVSYFWLTNNHNNVRGTTVSIISYGAIGWLGFGLRKARFCFSLQICGWMGTAQSHVSHPSSTSWIVRTWSFHGDGRGVREQTDMWDLVRSACYHSHLILWAKTSHMVKPKVKDEEVHSTISEVGVDAGRGE